MVDTQQTSIVIVDDDHDIRNLLQDFLVQYHYKVFALKNGQELISLLAQSSAIDLILLDIMLPGIDGIELCKRVREKSAIPIIMLTALNSEVEKILSLELGADDYIAKPFNPRELLARIKAVLRRSQESNLSQNNNNSLNKYNHIKYEFSGWVLDISTRRLVSPDDVEVALSTAIFNLLVIFLENPQRILTRDHLMDLTKGREAMPFDRSIDVLISRLRQKIENHNQHLKLIKTVRSGGYLFTSSVNRL